MDCDGEDYITNLPECIIGHILSRLPTKDAVKTCVLSKDWEYKWTSIYKIDMSDKYTRNVYEFVDIMERMSHFSLSHHVRSFALTCRNRYDLKVYMRKWILPVLGPNLEEFTLTIHSDPGFIIPQTILKCTSVRCLIIKTSCDAPCTFKIPVMYTFQSLMHLELLGIDIVHENSDSDTMILNFPVLKTCNIGQQSKWLNVKCVEIRAPSLEKFESKTIHDNQFHDYYSIKINGAKMAEFIVGCNLHSRFILSESTIVCARVIYTLDCYDHVKQHDKSRLNFQSLLNELSSVKYLIIQGSPEQVVNALSKTEVPPYEKLERLRLCDDDNLALRYQKLKYGSLSDADGRALLYQTLNHVSLLKLLHSAQHLKFLDLSLGFHKWNAFDYDAVRTVPFCVASSLEKVKIEYHYSALHEFHLERFILMFGARLKMFLFSVDGTLQEREIFGKLSALPKASTCLQIVICQRM